MDQIAAYIPLLHEWQDFAGAFLGALIPILFSLALLWWQNNRQFMRTLAELDMLIASALTGLYAARKELELFNERMDAALQEIPTRPATAFFFADTNFPTVKLDYGDKFLNTGTRSLYLANKLLACDVMLKDINNALADLQYEFRRGLRENHERIVAASSMDLTAERQKQLLSSHLAGMKTAVQGILLDANIPVASKALATARQYLHLYYKAPNFVRLRYEGPFRMFGGVVEVDKRLEARVARAMADAEERYKEQWKGFSTAMTHDNSKSN